MSIQAFVNIKQNIKIDTLLIYKKKQKQKTQT